MVNATYLGITSEAANNETFNVGTGVAVDVLTVAKVLVEKYNKPVPLNITGNYRLGDIRHNYADISKISSMLGFKSTVDFEMGIGAFTNWVNGQEIGLGKYEESLTEMKRKGLFK